MTGTLRWGRTPVGGVRVELWQQFDGGVITSTTSSADGTFTLRPAQPLQAEWFVAWNGQPYITQAVPLFLAPDPAARCVTHTFDPQLTKTVSTISIAGTSACGAGTSPCDIRGFPMIVGWSPMPGASYYCIEILSNDTGQFLLTGPVCDGSPSYMYSGPSTTYTVTTALRPGRYQFIVLAVLAGDGTHAAPFDGITIGSGDIYFRVN